MEISESQITFRTRCAGRLIACVCAALLIAGSALAQNVEINGEKVQVPADGSRKAGQAPHEQQRNHDQSGLSWGSNINEARTLRAANQALTKGSYAQAITFAEQATRMAKTDANAWFLLGYAARLGGKTQESLDAYHQGLAIQPSSIDGLSGLAQTYLRMGKSDEAQEILLKIIAANPQRENDLLMAAEIFLHTEDYWKALNLLQRAEGIHPSIRTEVLMATGYMKVNQPARAKEMLERAKQHGGKNPEVLRALANYYRETKDYASAIASLKLISRKNVDTLAELGWTYQLSGDWKGAAENYGLAAKAVPKEIQHQLSAASAWVRAGESEKAKPFLDRAQQIDANHYRLHAIRAEIARDDSNPNEAIREYNLALAHIPEAPAEGPLYPIELRMSLANLYQSSENEEAEKQQFDLAFAEISKLDMQGSERPEFLRLRAAIKAARGDAAGAEEDYKQAMTIDPNNPDIMLGYAGFLWKAGRSQEAKVAFGSVLKVENNNKIALISLGYLTRDMGDLAAAEGYYREAARLYPKEYIPSLALGDLFVAQHKYEEAQASYDQAFKLTPTAALIVAGGAHNAIEWHKLDLAEQWLGRAEGRMNDEPHVMRERERFFMWKGQYKESAVVGWKAIRLLPKDRDVAVYLGYDLYNMERYDDVLNLANRYENILPKEANFPLLAGYAHKQHGLLYQAEDDYTRAISIDPQMVEAYVNRGYVLNDLQEAKQATTDFEQALKLAPENGVAQLGIAFSYLELHRPSLALEHGRKAQTALGESGATHLVLAGAYRQQRLLTKAADEYRAALHFSQDDLTLTLALAQVLSEEHHYQESIDTYQQALAVSSDDDALIQASLANNYAHLRDRNNTYRSIEAAESSGSEQAAVYLATGNALLALGERDAAMERYQRSLDAPDADRVATRLSLAELFLKQGHFDDARQQISLGFAEARIGEATPVTNEDLLRAGNLMLGLRDFDTSRKLYQAALTNGADSSAVAVGVANTYLAEGRTSDASAELSSLGASDELTQDYDYQLAMGNLFRQRGNLDLALTSFARASALTPEGDINLQRDELDVAAEDGLPVNRHVSIISDSSFSPIYEDETIYQLDQQIFGATTPGALPPPRTSYESRETTYFRVKEGTFPMITGFAEERNARGQISYPSVAAILNRDTYDTTFNGGLSPVVHLGPVRLTLDGGLQFTIRRDKESPINLDQNLFRQFLYLSTNPVFNWVTLNGYAIHESGPFSLQNLNSGEKIAHLEFRVGRPWGKTAFLTGYNVRDLQFHPLVREFFSTSTYAGIEHQFGEKLKVSALGEVIRSWRVQDQLWANGQAMRPAAEVTYAPNLRWNFEGSFSMSRGFGLHEYDNYQTGFMVTYMKAWHGRRSAFPDGADFPLRFSVGMRSQDFYSFTGTGSHSSFGPVFRVTLF